MLNNTHAANGEVQALQRGVLRRRDGEQARVAVELGTGGLDILVVGVSGNVHERGARVDNASSRGQDRGARAVGNGLVDAPVLARRRRARERAVHHEPSE